MATQKVELSASLQDSDGIRGSTQAYADADDTKTVAQMITDAGAWLTALDNVSDAKIVAASLKVNLPLDGLKGSPVSIAAGGAPLEQTGVINFGTTASPRKWGFTIPAISNGATVLSGDRLVTTGGDPIPLLITLLTTAQTVLTFVNSHYQVINAALDGLISFREKRKQLQRSSFVANP